MRAVVEAYRTSRMSLVVPSYRMRRGHPWLVTRPHWEEILAMMSPASLRDFLNRHTDDIHYVEIDQSTILQDLDTPEDYLRSRP